MPKETGIHYKYIPQKITEITGITDKDIIEKSVSQEEATLNMYKYIEEHSEEGPIYLIAHNGLTFDFIFFNQFLIILFCIDS